MGYNNAQGLAGGFSMPADERDALAKEALRRAEEKKQKRKVERLAARPDIDPSSLKSTEEQNDDESDVKVKKTTTSWTSPHLQTLSTRRTGDRSNLA